MDTPDLGELAELAAGTKPWWRSRTIIAALVSIAVVGLGALGVTVDEETKRVLIDETYAVVGAGTLLAAAGGTIYGRVKARKAVTLTAPKAGG